MASAVSVPTYAQRSCVSLLMPRCQQVRSTRFGDFPSTVSRTINTDEKNTQTSTLGQAFSNNNWEASSGIWGNPIGSGLPNGKRDASRTRGMPDGNVKNLVDADGTVLAENTTFEGPSGSSQLATSSVADPWGAPRGGSWSQIGTTSPTMSTSGSTSPVRHRGSNANGNALILEAQKASPYTPAERAIGQGPGLTNRPLKSNLDPSSGPFKYPFQNITTFGALDDKENMKQDAYGAYMNGNVGRDRSAPPSRQSQAHSSTSTTRSTFGNDSYSFGGHTPNNSMHVQRPSFSGRTPSFPTMHGGRFEMNEPSNNSEPSYSRGLDREAENDFMENGNHETNGSGSGGFVGYGSQQQQNSSSHLWNTGLGSSTKVPNYLADAYAETSYSEKLNLSKGPPRSSDRGSISPSSDYRRQPNSPKYYSVSNTPSGELDPAYLRSVRPGSISELDRGMQRLQFPPQHQYFAPPVMYNGQYAHQYQQHPNSYDFSSQHGYRPNAAYTYQQMPMPPYAPNLSTPRGPARDNDLGHGVRSTLLEEFRSNAKSSKRYVLKDIYNHVVEFSGDQHGSRFIQQQLETANSDEKDQVFREIQPNALQLMTDVFGNYVIQKLFEHGNQVQKKVLAETMKNHVSELSLQMYGCRVVQKALEHVLVNQQAELVRELQTDVLKFVKDQNGNHVIQKAIERVPTEQIQFIIEAFRNQVHTLATHPYGCRVIQRMLEFCSEKDQASVLEELHVCSQMLVTDQYGNYVVQHVIANGKQEDRDKLIKVVSAQVLHFSKHKFASNVVEKCVQFGSDEQRHAIVATITSVPSDGTCPMQLMMKDQYGNYVIRKF
jgi:mRNA-binding protein PUF3